MSINKFKFTWKLRFTEVKVHAVTNSQLQRTLITGQILTSGTTAIQKVTGRKFDTPLKPNTMETSMSDADILGRQRFLAKIKI